MPCWYAAQLSGWIYGEGTMWQDSKWCLHTYYRRHRQSVPGLACRQSLHSLAYSHYPQKTLHDRNNGTYCVQIVDETLGSQMVRVWIIHLHRYQLDTNSNRPIAFDSWQIHSSFEVLAILKVHNLALVDLDPVVLAIPNSQIIVCINTPDFTPIAIEQLRWHTQTSVS